jgi:DNA-binding beta-propeller fold protein YncE
VNWQQDWVAADVALYGEDSWAHPDLAVTSDQRIVGFRSGGDSFWLLDRDGHLVGEWGSDLGEGHGLTIARSAEAEELWVADPGVNPQGVQEDVWTGGHGHVLAFDLDGNRLAELPTPGLPVYGGPGAYRPTTVEVERAGDGAVWVADGYGASLVHKLSRRGDLLLTLSGEEGAGRFDCPHGILIDRRRPQAQLYVTDRGNDRIAVYDLDGNFLRVLGEGWRAPSGLAVRDEQLVVAELEARLTILDGEDRVVERIGDDPHAMSRPGWPNALDGDGRTVRPDLRPGLFNSPHGLAVDADGGIYVAEWVLGGRMVRIRRD